MGEMRGYTCDGGCGATTVLDHVTDMLGHHGWWHCFTPDGMPTLYACSAECLALAVGRVAQRRLPA